MPLQSCRVLHSSVLQGSKDGVHVFRVVHLVVVLGVLTRSAEERVETSKVTVSQNASPLGELYRASPTQLGGDGLQPVRPVVLCTTNVLLSGLQGRTESCPTSLR